MIEQLEQKKFTEFYDNSYNDVLRYIVCHVSNLNDVNDILQETYLELYRILCRKKLDNSNINAYIIKIASNKIKKYYSFLYKIHTLSLFSTDEKKKNLIDSISSDIDLEKNIINNDINYRVWEYIKTKKAIVGKIFFLYYKEDMSIKEISNYLNVSESNIKNHLYRTLKELQNIFGKDWK